MFYTLVMNNSIKFLKRLYDLEHSIKAMTKMKNLDFFLSEMRITEDFNAENPWRDK